MNALQRIRQAVIDQKYRISGHANEEMSEDDLKLEDVVNIIRTGKINKKFGHDPRGTRYEIAGITIDGRQGYIVCRFLHSGTLLVITAYI